LEICPVGYLENPIIQNNTFHKILAGQDFTMLLHPYSTLVMFQAKLAFVDRLWNAVSIVALCSWDDIFLNPKSSASKQTDGE
jgi:hypothetical protein